MAEYDKTDSPQGADSTAERMAGIRKRFKAAEDADKELRDRAREDIEFAFVSGKQWDNHLGEYRGSRPKYEFNKLRPAIKQVINSFRQQTPSIKLRPSEDGNKDLAEIREGLVRNIQARSRAEDAYDWGMMYAVAGGFGAWTVDTEYADDGSFDQDIVIRRVADPFGVYFDPTATELDRRDARYCFVQQHIPRAEFKRKYPKAELVDFDGPVASDPNMRDWYGSETVRVAEYWYKNRETKTIHQLSDGRVVDAKDWDKVAEAAAHPPIDPKTQQPIEPPVTVVQSREVTVEVVKMEIVSGREVLEGPFDWAGKFIPVVPVWGDYIVVDGKAEWYGLTRMGRDAQMLYNYDRCTGIEVMANQPRAPYLYTPAMIEGFESEWANFGRTNSIGLPYNPDPKSPGGAPRREPPPSFPAALFQAAEVDDADIKGTTGIFQASLGQASNETSGKAIQARRMQGDITTFDYMDNAARAIRYTGEIINDLIPHIYDTQREMQILGDDDEAKYVTINKPVFDPQTQQWVTENDLTQGRYDIVCTTGPNYATQRMETLDAMMELIRTGGPLQPLAFYIALKNMDLPGIDDVIEGARRVAINAGLLEPGPNDPHPQPPPVNPKDQAQAAKYQAGAQKDLAQTAKYETEAQNIALENQLTSEQLKALQHFRALSDAEMAHGG